MSFRAGSKALTLPIKQKCRLQSPGQGLWHTVTFPVVFSHSYVSVWKTKGPACTENMVASENLLSFVVMKENGQKDYRSLQIIALC